MDDVTVAVASADGFDSLSELRGAHNLLLEDYEQRLEPEDADESAVTRSLASPIGAFVARGLATGAVLDDLRERTGAQTMVDYWTSLLIRCGLPAPRARLQPFDEERLPRLDDDCCPYVGLEPIRDARLLFGRDADVEQLAALVAEHRLVVVHGSSGSGKSSLVFGGLVPRMAAAGWTIAATFTPGRDPVGRLAAVAVDGRCLVVIDQLEEVFTLIAESQLALFDAALAQFLENHPDARVVVALREEFYDRVPRIAAFAGHRRFSMQPLGYAELVAAIQGPAATVNLQFERGVVEDLVTAVLGQPAALPLLQYSLRQLWRLRRRNRITREALDRIGGPRDALERGADAFLKGRDRETRDEIKRILVALVRVDELLEPYRQPVERRELLAAGRANTREVIELLASEDLVRVAREDGEADAVVEIKHEALLRNWPTLGEWIVDKRKHHRRHLALSQAARTWDGKGRSAADLYRGSQLDDVAELEGMSPLEREFVDASLEARRAELEGGRRRRRQVRVASTAVLLVVVAVLSALTFYARTQARRARRLAASVEKERREVREKLAAIYLELGRQALLVDRRPLVAISHLTAAREANGDDPIIATLFHEAARNAWLVVMRHDDEVISAAFGPDGTRVVTASKDGTARVWDAATGRAVSPPLAHESTVESAAFSPDGTRVVTASWDQTARVWDAATGRVVSPALAHDDQVRSAAFSPDGTRVLTASEDQTARVWDAATGRAVSPPLAHDAAVLSVAFSRDRTRVVTASQDKNARVWDVATGRAVSPLLAHAAGVRSAAFSPDGTRVVTASVDKTARVWDAATGRAVSPPLAHDGAVWSAAFSPDGTRVVTASEDQTARVWDAATGRAVSPPLAHAAGVWSAAFSPDGTRVVTASEDKTARVWDAATGRAVSPPLAHDAEVWSAAFSPDGTRVVTASDDGTARVWDVSQDHRSLDDWRSIADSHGAWTPEREPAHPSQYNELVVQMVLEQTTAASELDRASNLVASAYASLPRFPAQASTFATSAAEVYRRLRPEDLAAQTCLAVTAAVEHDLAAARLALGASAPATDAALVDLLAAAADRATRRPALVKAVRAH